MDELELQRQYRRKMALVLVDLIICLWILWKMLPEHRQAEVKMRCAQMARQASLRLARVAGRNGMSLELVAGTRLGGTVWYETAYQIMQNIYLKAERLYEQGRPT